jgi:cathepsin K
MKNYMLSKKISVVFLLLFLTISCVDWDDNLELPSEFVEIEVSPNDPKEPGLLLGCPGVLPEILTSLTINPNLPVNIDLSPLMPPVRSQGSQGSCVSWATAYYMKSYQEKVQYGYEYYDYSTVMSPAFIYNQTKIPGDCSVGSCIEGALYALKTKGVNTWQEFPYGQSCTLLPTETQLATALNHKISSSYVIENETLLNSQTYTRLEIAKNLLYLGNPVIIGMELDTNFSHALPKNTENIYIYNHYDASHHYGSHAMLIVGYDDTLQAFKVVNSWGSGWGNEGYCWISYNFFKATDDPQYESGLLATYTAYD